MNACTHTHTHTHFLHTHTSYTHTHTHTHTHAHTVPSRQTLINCMNMGKRHHCGVDGERQGLPSDGCPGAWAGRFVESLVQNPKIREQCIYSGINVFLNISRVERVNVLFFALRWKHNTRDTESQLSKADAEITKSLLKWVLKKMVILSGVAPTWLHQYLFFWGTCVYVVGCKWNPGQSWPGIKESFRALQNH